MFDKNTSGSNTSATRANKFAYSALKSKIVQNKKIAKELQKPFIRKFDNQNVF